MYSQQSTNTNMSAYSESNQSQADPISRAVADNIMGKLSNKKPQVRCHDCQLDFTSQVVLEAHLQGGRHAKQIRSKTIMETLQQTNIAFSKDEVTNGLRCNPCNVLLNSIQQLQTHLNGNRHKKKVAKGDWSGKEIVSRSDVALNEPHNAAEQVANVQLLVCGPCNKFFNSPSQLEVHMASQKHADKINHSSGKNAKKKRFFPYRKKDQTVGRVTTRPANIALTNNFVSAGYQQYS